MDPEDVHQRWAEISGEYSPEYYADFGEDETSEWLYQVLNRLLEPDAAVLEVGCSAGRHLAYLRDRGFENLAGIDINEDARDAMEDAFPELAADGEFYFEAIEDIAPEFDDGRFDAVFSVETLELVPPEHDHVFDELVRITDDILVTVENEGPHDDKIVLPTEVEVDVVADFPLYHRTWNQIFTERGMAEIDSAPVEMDTFRLFRKRTDG